MKFNDAGWNGFCQAGFNICPDAVANKDYSYYWRSLGPKWVNLGGQVDKIYCARNGWLKPEFRAIFHNFTALQQKGEEECTSKWSKPEYRMDTLGIMGVKDALMESVKYDAVSAVRKRGFLKTLITEPEFPGNVLMNGNGPAM